MRFVNSAIASAAILSGHLANCEDSGKEPKAAVKDYVHFSFDKLRGSNYDSATLGAKPEARLRKRADGYEEIEIINQQNFYSVELAIGTPPQNVTVLIDTGSSDLWVGAPENPYCRAGSSGSQDDSIPSWYTRSGSATSTSSGALATMDCSEFGVFNKSRSSTFQSNDTSFYISYGDRTFASGGWGTDTLNLGDVNVTDLSFAVANRSNSSVGVFGIGLPGLQTTYSGQSSSNSYTYQNFPMKLKDEGLVKHNAYSLFLNDPDAHSGSILFGALDHSKYSGQLFTVPLLNPYRSRGIENPIEFDITVQGVGIRDDDDGDTTVLTTTKFPALLDSGTTLTYMPYQLTELIARKIDATYSSTYGYYMMECPSDDDDTQLVFDFGGFQISANLSNYVLSASSSSSQVCFLGIIPLSGSSAIFGDNFLINAYVVYDLENYEISMAQSRFGANDTDIEIISGSVPGAVRGAAYSATWSTAQSISSGGGTFTTASVTSGGVSTRTTGNSAASAGSSTSTGRSSSSSAGGMKMVPTSSFVLLTWALSFLI